MGTTKAPTAPKRRTISEAAHPIRSQAPEPPQLLTVAETMTVLNTSRTTVYRLINDQKLPAYTIGGRGVRFRLDDVLALISRVA